MDSIKFGIITVSDTCHDGEKTDESGPELARLLQDTYPNCYIHRKIVPDEISRIKNMLLELCVIECDVIFTAGGTGFAPRDVTPEATKLVITKETPGISYAILNKGLTKTPLSMLSRAVCGIRDKTLIINLSGSVKAVTEQFSAIKDVIPHAVSLIRDTKELVQETHEAIQNKHVASVTKIEKKIPYKSFVPSKVKINAIANRLRSSPYKMISVDAAHDIITSVCEQGSDFELMHIQDVLGRVLAEDIRSIDALPPFPSSIKDGYAVISSDGKGKRTVVEGVAAGDSPILPVLQKGQCMRVNTGAPIPPGADAVVQIEDTELLKKTSDNTGEIEIHINVSPTPGQDIRKIGSDIEAHTIIFIKGIILNAAEIGVLATLGRVYVKVYKRPKIGVISTGNELQDPNVLLQEGRIRDSNKLTLLTILKQYGYHGEDFGLAKDEPDAVKHILEQAFNHCDMVITSGGVSMGEYDVIKKVLETDFQAKIHFGRVNMKPGKPTTFATCLYKNKIKTIFGLPGNPVSATVTCLLFVIPALRHCENIKDILYPKVEVDLDFTPKLDPERPEYHRVHLKYGATGIIAKSTGNQISSKLTSFAGADGLLILPANKISTSTEPIPPPESLVFPVCSETNLKFNNFDGCTNNDTACAQQFSQSNNDTVIRSSVIPKEKYWCYLLGKY